MAYPNVVEGQVIGHETLSVTLRVGKVLRGSVHSDEITVVHTGCYVSLPPEDMELGHTYVLPLPEPEPESTREPLRPGWTVMVESGPEPGQYAMPVCTHSGLELIDGTLYTFEHERGGQRRLQRYMSYPVFQGWVGLLVVIDSIAALYQRFGLVALLVTLVSVTAGAYFAARDRPWLLVPVLFLATLLYGLNVANSLTGEHSVFYGGLSWMSLAITIGGAVLGYLTRRRLKRAASP
jgi:hypothetical protein